MEQHSSRKPGVLKSDHEHIFTTLIQQFHSVIGGVTGVPITVAKDSNQSATLLLPQDVLDDLIASEKEALSKVVEKCLTSQSFWSIMAHNLTYEPKAPSIPSAGSRSLRPPPRSAPLLPLMPRSVLTFGHPKPRVEFSRQHKAYRFPLMQLPTELRVMIAKFALHHPERLEWVERTTGKVLKGQLYVVTTAMATTLTNSTLLLGCASCSIRRFEDLLLMPMSYASASIQCISIVFPEDAWTDWTEGISISEPSKRLWISCRRAFPKAQPHSSMACRSQTSPTHISRAIGESSLRWSVV